MKVHTRLPSTDVTFPNPFLIHAPEETQQPFYTYILFSRTYVNDLSDEWGISMCDYDFYSPVVWLKNQAGITLED